ncbi:MAG: hypothetical protein A3E51_23210 [Burkholderiales bacterium RIFCSPHIGHO2_12_FULL_67_38]|nr:MAG: hypothetical protein A3I64_06065 [Burkholderiales bacterium RIFCSPLOWO2_02_FULL_67_64]OGB50040.1 MAG: hypothetical protein A3E51_23210 [Burkholderiales bacterium RIFCSPHIGHO2_12_FULL_67_38]
MNTAQSPPIAVHAEAAAPTSATLRALRASVRGWVEAFGQALGSVFFIGRPWLGLLLWGALLSSPALALFALCGLLSGVLVQWVLRIQDAPGLGGGIKANALLTAVVSGWMSGPMGMPWAQQLVLAAAAAIAAALVTAALMRMLARSFLPVLLWGYCLVAAMLFSVCPDCTVRAAYTLPVWPVPTDAQGWLGSFLRSMASLMYSPHAVAGVLVCTAVLMWSRAMFLAGLAGWIGGVVLSLGFQRLGLSFVWLPLSYNYFIAGMALGAVIFLPGRLCLPVAAVAGALTAFFGLVLQYVLGWSAASYLPMSSALAIWVGMGALTLAGERAIVERNATPGEPPEQRWWKEACWHARYGRTVPLFAVPVAGELQIAQGFDGRTSHMGMYRHALDFQRSPAAEAVAGSIWGAAITAPAPGMVERVHDGVADNPLGVCNYAEKWGNHVVIRLDAGGWAMLAHLQLGTVAVVPGARVETGSYLGRVGNSGRSPVPHLHLHLQGSPEPGAATRPFRLANYFTAEAPASALTRWHASAVPPEEEILAQAQANPAVYGTLVGMAPGTAVWTSEVEGDIPRAFHPGPARMQQLQVRIDSLGEQVLDAGPQGGRLVLGLDPDALRVMALDDASAPLLRLLAMGAVSIPYAVRVGTQWSDVAPVVPGGGWWRPWSLLLAPYRPHPFPVVNCTCAVVVDTGVSGSTLAWVSTLQTPDAAGPHRLTCRFAPLRGFVKLQAEFATGVLTFRLLSFDPAPPG